MNRVALFVALLCLGMMAAPGVAQQVGLDGAMDDVDPVGQADAHVEPGCLKGPCVCYLDPTGYHCHDGY